MQLRKVIELLSGTPKAVQHRELVLFGPNGMKFQVCEDVSQLDMQRGKILLYVEPVEN